MEDDTRLELEAGSFRDRSSSVFYRDGAVYRAIDATALEEWEALRRTAFFARRVERGEIVRTARLDPSPDFPLKASWAATLEHERIPFITYPYEWSFAMLKDAALLHLALLRDALREGMIMKDATSYNVQWKGASPVFIDIPSFVRLGSGETWVGYRQFCQLFLYPLFLQGYKDVDFQPWLRGLLDGIPPEQMKNLLSFRNLLQPGAFTHVYLQAKLQNRYASSAVRDDIRVAGFHRELIESNIRRLEALVAKLSWARSQSEWSDYVETNSYNDADRGEKAAFVRAAVAAKPHALVWDLGCNVGEFSRIAAEHADYVVAFDSDSLVIDRLYRALRADNVRKILPLVMNLADPSPALGWRASERRALTDRGKPSLTLCLALIHHLAITANIPLKSFLGWLSNLETDLVIEFVGKSDPMVQRLLSNRPDIYSDYDVTSFERALEERFVIRRRLELSSKARTLYYAERRAP